MMAFELEHTVVSTSFTPTAHKARGDGFCTVNVEGEMQFLHPGRLQVGAIASFQHRTRVEEAPGHGGEDLGSDPQGGRFKTETIAIPVQITLYTPDGHEFTGSEIRLTDLRRVRDLRGLPIGPWRYKLSGESEHRSLDDLDTIREARGFFVVKVIETVRSESAGPLVSDVPLDGSRQSVEFDLFRVGTLVAELSNVIAAEWRGTLSLVDPDGVPVRSTLKPMLTFPVELATLAKSRGPDGRVRRWRLEVAPQGGVVVGTGNRPKLSATIIGTGRITTAVLQSRIQHLLGPRGRFIRIYGENAGGDALARLRITDTAAAEALDMHGLLDKPLARARQDPDVDASDIQANVVYTLARRSQDVGYGTSIDVSSLRVGTIDIVVGPGVHLGATVPAVRLTVGVAGEAKVKLGPATIGTAQVRGGSLEMEIGIAMAPDGTPQTVCWTANDPFDIDLHWATVLGLGAIAGPLIGFGVLAFTELLEGVLNDGIASGARAMFADANLAPRLLMTIFGAHLRYRAIRVEGGTFVFEHVAPLEHDPHPRAGYDGAIGRTIIEVTPGRTQFVPPFVGDTWATANLSKIDHIVAVMMENRSYDHVLGYRAQGAQPDGADGLTAATIDAIQAANGGQHKVRKLSQAGFADNALQLKTRIPKSVGHKLEDVREQLAGQTQRADGGQINDPKGFVENFARKKLGSNSLGVVADDVLGYYEASDLPFYAYLAQHYGYCDRYFSSHPGPTLPNRMYALTGDLQYDRFGAPILDNNDGDNFLLSRTTTIYDLLTRKGVSWRVYESEPSVTMLRMFARYATNNTDIVPLARLEADVASGNLPAFTVIEPAMHHHPQDDDHPDADMYRGQIFLKRVYDALRSNPAVWQKTLLLITYDEHGGLYDHVVPPIADVLSPGSPGNVDTGGSGGGAAHRLLQRADHRAAAVRHPEKARVPAGALVADDESDGGDVRMMARRPPGDEDPDPGNGGGDPRPRPHPGNGGGDPENPRWPPPPQTRERVHIRYGVRVPTFVVSPWVKPGKGPSLVLDHCSILKTVLARFGGGSQPFLNDRVHSSQSFEAFLTEAQPRMNVPPSPALGSLPIDARLVLPGGSQIVTPPLSRKQMRDGEADFHEVSGRLARMLGR